jgi:hypothetical protein
MRCTVMAAAKRHRELVTYPAAHCAVLSKSDVMGVNRTTAANQTRLGRHVLDVIPIADATWFRYGEGTLVDAFGSLLSAHATRTGLISLVWKRRWQVRAVRRFRLGALTCASPRLKRFFYIDASGAVRLFFALRFSWAQTVTVSTDRRPANSPTRRSRRTRD